MSVRWLPLESNPDVINEYMYEIGVQRSVKFTDVYSLDPADLACMLPSPIHAFLLLFPIQAQFDAQDCALGESNSSPPASPFYLKQTIDNACGFIALLHAAINTHLSATLVNAPGYILPDSLLARYLETAQSSPSSSPEDRGRLLEHNSELAETHRNFALQGSTRAPATQEEEEAVDLHFVALVPGPDGASLWELDGRKRGPLLRVAARDSRGFVQESMELVKMYMERADDSSVSYSVLALVPNDEE